jgi:hypothetical protein
LREYLDGIRDKEKKKSFGGERKNSVVVASKMPLEKINSG